MIRGRIAAWIFDNIALPSWAAPYVCGLIIGRWPRKSSGGRDASNYGKLQRSAVLTPPEHHTQEASD